MECTDHLPCGGSPVPYRQLCDSFCFYLIQLPHLAASLALMSPFFLHSSCYIQLYQPPNHFLCCLSYPLPEISSAQVWSCLLLPPLASNFLKKKKKKDSWKCSVPHDLTFSLALEPHFSHKRSFLNCVLKLVCFLTSRYLLLLLRRPFRHPFLLVQILYGPVYGPFSEKFSRICPV